MDHERNLSSTKKSVFQLELLLGQNDSFLEVGVLDDRFQRGSNLRIQHLKIWEFDVLELIAMSYDRPMNRPSPLL